MSTPRFQHDCDQCVFLGRFNHQDLYVCPVKKGSFEASTLIARYGHKNYEYASGWDFWKSNSWIRKARKLAIALGYWYKFDKETII